MTTMLMDVKCVLLFAVVFAGAASADDTLQRELLARIEALEQQGREQATILQTQSVKLSNQENTIKEYKQRVANLENSIEKLMAATKQEDKQTEKLTENSLFGGINPVKQSLTESVIKKVSTRDYQGDGPIAFHAVLKNATEVKHIGVGQKIIFPDVLLNLGGCYHEHLGTFIAPRAGLYLFSVSITSYITDHTLIVVGVVKNGITLTGVLAQGESGHHDQGSSTLVTQLVAGDEVWVDLSQPADTSLWGGFLDNFSGCLLIPM